MFRKELQSFGHAFRGLKFLFQTQKHFRFHLLATLAVNGMAWYLNLEKSEWWILLLCCALVLGMEGLNSALEIALDRLHPEQHPMIGKAKDMAAAAVLICAIISGVVGIWIFLPYLL
ncbi:MAG: diacylglycerol kinase family protein [Bacteroidota bacterium]|nr:diacylglycerol kinase family protein [Bacteroidota bacterium]MDX5431590.1 diacylglycerol kinase family protein [Bacteroidota bacterium]MDX5470310.1 diacylglycerol kinase family protein [Bacteroidota bacterium]